MGFVMDGLMALMALVIVAWLLSLGRSQAQDRREANVRRQADKAERARRVKLARRGVLMRCLACQETFPGPVPPDGCPRCHLSTLVLPETEYRRRSRKEA